MKPSTQPSLFCSPATRGAVACLVVALAGGVGWGQPAGDGPDRSTRVEEAERVLPRVNREERVVTPTRARVAQPVRPGLTGGEEWGEGIALRPSSLPEGTFLIERPGRLIEAPGGRRVFVPGAADRVAGEGPMLVLPSATLERLELALTGAGAEPSVRVSGTVFVYHGRPHLLVSSYLLGKAASAPPTAADATNETASPEGAGVPESSLDDPDVRGLLEELEAARPAGGADPRGGAGGSGGAGMDEAVAGGVPPVPDGTPVVRRRGRLVRTGEGAWAFVFDNDTDDRLGSESMVVMPCLLLQRMERQALTDGDAHELIVSGRIHTHRGQAYLLPTMMLRVPGTGVTPMQ